MAPPSPNLATPGTTISIPRPLPQSRTTFPPQNSPIEIQTPFSRVHTCTHAHQHTKLTDCRARFYKFAIIIANFILRRLALKCTIQTHASRNCALTQPRARTSLPRMCVCLCAWLSPSSNSETCLAFSEKNFSKSRSRRKKHAKFAQLLTAIARERARFHRLHFHYHARGKTNRNRTRDNFGNNHTELDRTLRRI